MYICARGSVVSDRSRLDSDVPVEETILLSHQDKFQKLRTLPAGAGHMPKRLTRDLAMLQGEWLSGIERSELAFGLISPKNSVLTPRNAGS
jgi:hypothetical protein